LGKKEWGIEAWGGEGIWEFVSVTGQQLNLTLNSVTPLANAECRCNRRTIKC
jgi:hypothetical protein